MAIFVVLHLKEFSDKYTIKLADLKNRIDAFTKIGLFIEQHFSERCEKNNPLHDALDKILEMVHTYNGWFTPYFVKEAVRNLGFMLKENDLVSLCQQKETKSPKTVAVICAGNIPMVGFHDILCILLSGNTALIKLSGDDNVLLPFFLKLLVHFEPSLEEKIRFSAGKMNGFDAVIATGSSNSASHFEYYFSRYPHIIRKNRTSVAILGGEESADELKALGKDIFYYYGLGCRNVGKLMVPEGYNFKLFFENIIDYGFVIDNNKYGGNYDYQRAIYLLEQEKFLDNNFLLLKQSEKLHSPVATLFYDYYTKSSQIQEYLNLNTNHIQCVVGKGGVPFGYSQRPVISDFADRVNTHEFLVSL